MKKYIAIILSIICILFLGSCAPATETMYQLGIVVDGEFYVKSYQPMPEEVDESAVVGYIKSYTDTFPEKDGETNISKDLIDTPYAKVESGIAILYENEWYLCRPESENTGGTSLTESMESEANNEWTIQEISELFTSKAEKDWKIIECVSAFDFAFDRVGVVLYTDNNPQFIRVAFIGAEGNMQNCGVEAFLAEPPEFTYHRNGEVTFKVCSKDGTRYTQKITFSSNEDGVNFVSEAIKEE